MEIAECMVDGLTLHLVTWRDRYCSVLAALSVSVVAQMIPASSVAKEKNVLVVIHSPGVTQCLRTVFKLQLHRYPLH